jgi:disulfide bond formation protein DsbB
MIKITSKHLLILLSLAAATALATSFIAQYYFGMQPCYLCIWQIEQFAVILFFGVSFLIIPFLKKYQKIAVKIGILLVLINAGISFYHSGVERKIFKGLSSCSLLAKSPDNIEDLHKMLTQTKAIPCDKPQFIFLNLSLAEWNFLYCISLIIIIGRISVLINRRL